MRRNTAALASGLVLLISISGCAAGGAVEEQASVDQAVEVEEVVPEGGEQAFTFDSTGMPERVRELFAAAWDDVKAHSYPAEQSLIFKTYVQDTFPEWHRDIVIRGGEIIQEKYGGFYKFPEKPIYFVLGTDADWAAQTLQEIGDELGASQEEIDQFATRIRNENFLPNKDRPASGTNGELNGYVVQFFESWVDYEPNAFDVHASTHELWHPFSDAWGLVYPSRIGELPCWLREGQASMIGDVVGLPEGTFEEHLAVMMSHGGGWRSEENVWGGNLEEDIDGWCGDRGEYQDGDTIFTLLVGLHGWEKSIEFTDLPEELRFEWKQHFVNVYGFPVEDFYSEIEPLMVKFQYWAKNLDLRSNDLVAEFGFDSLVEIPSNPGRMAILQSGFVEWQPCQSRDGRILVGGETGDGVKALLSCGPDGQWHPEMSPNIPELNQETGFFAE